MLAAVNSFRVAHGLAALRESAALDRSARQHSLEMGRVGYFATSSADGTAFWKRIRRYYSAQGLRVLVGRREPALGVAGRERGHAR